jgi:hypothetical protein
MKEEEDGRCGIEGMPKTRKKAHRGDTRRRAKPQRAYGGYLWPATMHLHTLF